MWFVIFFSSSTNNVSCIDRKGFPIGSHKVDNCSIGASHERLSGGYEGRGRRWRDIGRHVNYSLESVVSPIGRMVLRAVVTASLNELGSWDDMKELFQNLWAPSGTSAKHSPKYRTSIIGNSGAATFFWWSDHCFDQEHTPPSPHYPLLPIMSGDTISLKEEKKSKKSKSKVVDIHVANADEGECLLGIWSS